MLNKFVGKGLQTFRSFREGTGLLQLQGVKPAIGRQPLQPRAFHG